MYSVTKRIEFCYGHRLLDYDGACRHPHGHNALAEIEVRSEALDRRNMVVDFGDIKRIVKGWIDERIRPDADGVFAFQVQDILVLVEPSASAEPWLRDPWSSRPRRPIRWATAAMTPKKPWALSRRSWWPRGFSRAAKN